MKKSETCTEALYSDDERDEDVDDDELTSGFLVASHRSVVVGLLLPAGVDERQPVDGVA